MEPIFHLYLWDRILPQVTMKLNMLHRSRLKPELSAYEQVDVIHNFERTSLEPLVFKIKIHKKPQSDSSMIHTKYMDGTLDQQYIIIDSTPATTLILKERLH